MGFFFGAFFGCLVSGILLLLTDVLGEDTW